MHRQTSIATASRLRHTIAFALLAAVFVTIPLFDVLGIPTLRAAFMYTTVGFVTWSMRSGRRIQWLESFLVVACLFGLLLGTTVDVGMPYLHLGPAVLVYGLTSFTCLRHVMALRRADRGAIFSALSTYLCVGLTWALLYAAIEAIVPGSSLRASDGEIAQTFSTYTYFSFTTLTTLGYGDVTAASPATQTLATLEALFGQIYLAILVGRLVGLQVTATSGRQGNFGAEVMPNPGTKDPDTGNRAMLV